MTMMESKTRFSGTGQLRRLRPQTLHVQHQLEQWTKSGRKHWDLYRHLLNPHLLADATHLVLTNKGSAGVDGVTCEEVRRQGWDFIRKLQSKLRSKTYRPQAVLRVYIPKRGGKKRPLGIPSLEDRVVQRALVLLLEPIYEQIFLPCSYGFRPKKRATDCVAHASQEIFRKRYVIDADIKSFFDNVSHRRLLGMLKRQIVDPRILRLVSELLRAGVFEGERYARTSKGTPQGGPLSPLLANIYLHYALDIKVEQVNKDTKGRFGYFRFADDYICACRTPADVHFMVSLMKGWLQEVGLDFHKEKSRAVDMSNEGYSRTSKFDFLGFKLHLRRFSDSRHRYWIARQPSEAARQQLRANLYAALKPNLSHEQAKLKVQQIWFGWSHYFKYGNSNRVFYRERYTVRREVFKYLRRKYRHQRRPVPWRKLVPIGKWIYRDIKPLGVMPGLTGSAKRLA